MSELSFRRWVGEVEDSQDLGDGMMEYVVRGRVDPRLAYYYRELVFGYVGGSGVFSARGYITDLEYSCGRTHLKAKLSPATFEVSNG